MNKTKKFFSWILFTRRGNITLWLSTLLLTASLCICMKFTHLRIVGILPPCPINTLFNIRCASCGGTRCVQALLTGHPLIAFYYNPVIAILAVCFAVMFAVFIVRSLKKNYTPPKYNVKLWVIIVIFVILFAFLFIRNMDFYRQFFY